jgi:hypothetical protein
MLRLLLRALMLLVAARVVVGLFGGGGRRSPARPAGPAPAGGDDKARRGADRLGGKIVDAEFEDLGDGGAKK